MSRYDVAVVGSGHNALIAAAYLAKEGKKVAVFERAERPGGAVQTRDDIFPGYRIDVGSSAHILIHLTPILQELDLGRYGLEYIDCDPWGFYPLDDGRAIHFWKDIDQTCDSIARISPRDADAYRRFLDEWRPISRAVLDVFLSPPKPGKVAWTMARSGGFGRGGLGQLQTILGSYRALLDSRFEHPAVRAAIEWMAAQSGPPPAELGSAPLAGWQALYHESGVKRAAGGSGALTEALVRMIRDHGGEVHTASPVRRIVVEGGRAVGMEVGGAVREDGHGSLPGRLSARQGGDAGHPAVRIGWRHIRGMGKRTLEALRDARAEAPFTSVEDVVRRAHLGRGEALHLARAGALEAFEPGRRRAAWEALRAAGDTLPLAPARRLPFDPRELDGPELIFLDYLATGICTHGHPMEHLRPRLQAAGFASSGDLQWIPDGAPIVVAGLVVARQHPSTAKGTVFVLLEDENGFINVIVPARLYKLNRETVKFSPFLLVEGTFERDGAVMNVVGRKFRRLKTAPIASQSHDFH